MEKMIPMNKKSKRVQKEYHNKQRGTWYGINPVTRTAPSGKAYNRNKIKRENRRIAD